MRRSRTRRRASRGTHWIGISVLVAALVGAALSPWLASRFAPPEELSREEWNLIVPDLEASLATAGKQKREGSGLVDGSLYLATHGFGRGDVVRPVIDTAVGKVVLELSRGSGPVQVNFPTTDVRKGASVTVSTKGWTWRGSQEVYPLTADGVTEISVASNAVYVNGIVAGSGRSGQIEIIGGEPAGKIRAISFYGDDGELVREHDFGGRDVSTTGRGIGAAVGAIIGLCLSLLIFVRRSAAAAFPAVAAALLPPIMCSIPSYAAWAALRERLFVTAVAPSTLRIAGLMAGFGLFILVSLVGSGALKLPDSTRRDISVGGAAAILAGIAAFATFQLPADQRLWAVPGLLFLGLPLWTAYRVDQPVLSVLVRDAPAWSSIAMFGWGWGCALAWLWRCATFFTDVPMLLTRHPRAGTDTALLLLLSMPLVAETCVRQTFLNEAWSPQALRGASVETVGGKGTRMGAFWQAECGPETARDTVYYFGGSSTGGAFQFTGHAEWTWPAQIHESLCEELAAVQGVRSLNYGDSGRDSFDVATVAATLFAQDRPSVVVYYGGINDILTETSSLTRKQRALLADTQSTVVGFVGRLSEVSRVFSGMSLLFRPKEGSAAAVSAVPLADAEENLRTLAAATAALGGQLLLVPEYAQLEADGSMLPYWQMEARLAAELPGVTLVDLYAIIPPQQRASLLADRNHLTREGSQFVAGLIAPIIAKTIKERRPAEPPNVAAE